MSTTELAHKLLNHPDFYKEGYSLQSLFKIRDALFVLYDYDLADIDLLIEVIKYLNQKQEGNIVI